jgi:hypothetical protein
MCCLAASLVILGPRFGILLWWLLEPARWSLAFDTFVWPFLGFLFVPWTTLMYVLVFPGGVDGFDWIWLGMGLLADVFSYAGGGYRSRDRFGGYSSRR